MNKYMMQLSFVLYPPHLKLKLLVPVKGDMFIIIHSSINTIVAYNYIHGYEYHLQHFYFLKHCTIQSLEAS